MRIHSDHYFHIGAAHLTAGKPCQDYAASSPTCIVVSDGCSTGGRTDVGARILALATARAMDTQRSLSERDGMFFATQAVLGLRREDMLATCMWVAIKDDHACCYVQGDGVLAYKYRSGDVWMVRYDWLGNMPYYPAYSQEDLPAFIAAHGGDENAPRFNVTFMDGTSQAFPLINAVIPTAGRTFGPTLPPLAFLELIAIFTDGVTQIENVPWQDAVMQFLNFKTRTGEFAKRRMIRGIKDMQQFGKGPIDDIAYAVMAIDEEP